VPTAWLIDPDVGVIPARAVADNLGSLVQRAVGLEHRDRDAVRVDALVRFLVEEGALNELKRKREAETSPFC